MTTEQAHAFNKDLCELMRHHGIRGIAGIAIEQDGNGGIMDLHDGISPVKEIVGYFVDIIEDATKELKIPDRGRVTGVDIPRSRNS